MHVHNILIHACKKWNRGQQWKQAWEKTKQKPFNYNLTRWNYRSPTIRKSHVNLGLGIGELWGCVGPCFWIQWRIPFLWSLHVGFCSRLRVPSCTSEDSNCSNSFTTCQNSGLLSGCKDQHCSIKALMAGGQSSGIAGLKFWKIPKGSNLNIAYI